MKKIIPVLLSALLLLSLLPATAAAAGPEDYTDIPEGWSREAILAAVENGLLQGSNGKIDPRGSLTRAQMAAILVRAFGVTSKSADLSAFTDVDPNAWYYRELSLAVGIGLLLGDGQGRLKPDSVTTREEVAVVLARAFYLLYAEANLSEGTVATLLGHYADADSIAPWARESMAALVRLDRLRGYPDGTLRPKASLSREEFAQLMHRLVARYITAPGEYTFESDGTVVIRVPGVILKNCVIAGDLILGDELVRADVTLENVTFANPSGSTTTILRLIVRSEEITVDTGDTPPLAGPDDGTTPPSGGGPSGGGPSTPTYTLDISLSASWQRVSTRRTPGLPGGGGDLFYLVLRDHLRDNAAYLESQTAPGTFIGLFEPLLDVLIEDVSLDMLADMTELTQHLTVAPGSAVAADRWKDPSVLLRDVEGQSTLIFDDAPFHTEITVDVGRESDGYTLQLLFTGGVDGLTVSSSLLTGSDLLYSNVFGSVERRLDALLAGYLPGTGLTAGDYVDRMETWFGNVPPDEMDTLITTAQGSVSPLLNRDALIRDAVGYDLTLHGPGFTIDVSAR
ncbi:MAG: S-layer homology domain-containing protein [Oscillospiraceae bacterium]|nr:S-layer homology domain-containing protein [Oscillospiraceae bacterium]